MSKNNKRNYTQYSNNKKPSEATLAVEEIKAVVEPAEVIEPEVKMVEEIVETVTLPKTAKGVVSDCVKLNIRVAPNVNADVACVLPVNSKVEIDIEQSTEEWFSVVTATGVEGYCMKQFISANV